MPDTRFRAADVSTKNLALFEVNISTDATEPARPSLSDLNKGYSSFLLHREIRRQAECCWLVQVFLYRAEGFMGIQPLLILTHHNI